MEQQKSVHLEDPHSHIHLAHLEGVLRCPPLEDQQTVIYILWCKHWCTGSLKQSNMFTAQTFLEQTLVLTRF